MSFWVQNWVANWTWKKPNVWAVCPWFEKSKSDNLCSIGSNTLDGVKISWVSHRLPESVSYIPKEIGSRKACECCGAFKCKIRQGITSNTWGNINVLVRSNNSSCHSRLKQFDSLYIILYLDLLCSLPKNIIYLNSIGHIFCLPNIVKLNANKAFSPKKDVIKPPVHSVSED